jgi:hypothetical protein
MGEKIHVTIFGAGVAGLSAAHELIERGFAVTVYEKRENPLSPGDCQVGGMARTQWSRVPGAEHPGGPAHDRMVLARPPLRLVNALKGRRDLWYSSDRRPSGAEADIRREKAEVRFAVNEAVLDPIAERRVRAFVEELKKYVDEHVLAGAGGKHARPDALPVPPHLLERLYVEGYRDAAEADFRLGEKRARVVHALVRELLEAPSPVNGRPYSGVIEVAVHDLGMALQDQWMLRRRERRVVRLRMQEVLLPGEHGYRFFPAFYRHLFDTMKRTPLLEEQRMTLEEFSQGVATADVRRRGDDAVGSHLTISARRHERYKLVETGRTTFDNVVSVNYHSIAQAHRPELPEVLTRSQPTSLREAMASFLAAQDELGFEALDLARYQLKVLEYVTMCAERRRELADVSWADFIAIDTYSEQFQKVMDIWPQALIGMRAYEADAQTSGNISVQMMLDQLRAGGFRDGTLNGPTSVAWLDPWRRYLEDQGVVFEAGELETIAPADASGRPVFTLKGGRRVGEHGYVILALPVEIAQQRVAELRDRLDPGVKLRRFDGTDLQRVSEFVRWNATLAAEPRPDGPLQHFSGIQYYLEQDHSLVRGHTYFANSPWGVTSISQAQFRVHRPDWRQQYRGILSVDIGSCYDPGRNGAPSVWKSTPDEIAREIWEQMNDAIGVAEQKLPDPLWYHIDDDLEFRRDAHAGVKQNHTPYLLSRPREFAERPGRISHERGVEYDVSLADDAGFHGIVLAGSYMQTYTRLATMESANESGRHAVNTILRDCRRRGGSGTRVGQLCPTWNPEDEEFPDLLWLKELDQRLHARKLPHLVAILELDPLLSTTPGADPLAQVGRLIEVLSDARDFPRSLLRLGAPHAVLRMLAEVFTGRRADG